LLGKPGRGFAIALQTLDFGRSGVAALSVGVGRAALELAVAYAKERQQFGAPILMNQGVSFMLADMSMKVEAARLLTWQAAWMADQGLKATAQSAMAKCFASDTAMAVTTDAVQILGGVGYMKDRPVEKLMRDAKLLQIYEGTNQIQRMVIARQLAKM
ncbi:MAG: acyl-CoA dehydrogenase family protein, partial [Anaerolineae bacterium]